MYVLMFAGIGGVCTENTVALLHAVHALGCRELYFVDVAQWQEALGGMAAVVLIQILGVVFMGMRYPFPCPMWREWTSMWS